MPLPREPGRSRRSRPTYVHRLTAVAEAVSGWTPPPESADAARMALELGQLHPELLAWTAFVGVVGIGMLLPDRHGRPVGKNSGWNWFHDGFTVVSAGLTTYLRALPGGIARMSRTPVQWLHRLV